MKGILASVLILAGCMAGELDSSEPQEVPAPAPSPIIDPGPSPAPSQLEPPRSLTRMIVSEGVATVRPEIRACAPLGAGIVKVHVKVAASGTVTSATVKTAPTPDLGACAARAMERATFAATLEGGSFSYPFLF